MTTEQHASKALPKDDNLDTRSFVPRPSPGDLYEEGKSLRNKCPRKSHAVWNARMDIAKLVPTIKDAQARKRLRKRLNAARNRGALEHDFPKLAEVVGRLPTIKDNPPLIYHWRKDSHGKFFVGVKRAFASYWETMQEDRRRLLDRYELHNIAIKGVGVGSVGTSCGILLLLASEKDPLFRQVKEARPSVLEAYAGKSVYANHGQRVVNGYRLMPSASDLFLGWGIGPKGRHCYVRQLKDVKVGMLVEAFTRSVMMQYAEICGWTLAHAHARSGEAAKISGYLSSSNRFDAAIADFSKAFADQSERDHKILVKSVREGRLEADRANR